MNQETTISKSARIWISSISLIFCWLMTAWIVLYGDQANSLHQSALSWGFTLNIGILVALGLGSVVEYLPTVIKTK